MKKTLVLLSGLVIIIISYGQSVKSKIRLWQPESFCNMPDDINICYKISCRDCSWKYAGCEKIDKKKLKAVRITFCSSVDSTLSLTSKFENISLQSKNSGRILHPVAILMAESDFNHDTGESYHYMSYMTNHFKVEYYTLTFDTDVPYDLILLFDDAVAGDNIVIDNFIQGEILK